MAQLKGLDGNIVTGRELYSDPSITGLNRVPITILSSYILAKASLTSGVVPFSLEELTETLLVDGPWIEWKTPPIKKDEELCGVWDAKRDQFTLRIEKENQQAYEQDSYILRQFKSNGSGWTITDFTPNGNDGYDETPGGSAPASALNYIFNAVSPVGVLMPAQVTYNRIEEIANTIRRFQTGPGAKTLIVGNVRNKTTATADLESDDPYAFVGGSGVVVDRMASTAAIDQLIAETTRLQPLYYQQVHMVDTTSPVQRPSGQDRALVLGPMMRFVDALTSQITRVLDYYGAAWRYERIHTTDVLDRTQQMALLIQQRDLKVITQSEFDQRAGEL